MHVMHTFGARASAVIVSSGLKECEEREMVARVILNPFLIWAFFLFLALHDA